MTTPEMVGGEGGEAEGDTRTFLFDSSTHIMWAEEMAQEEGIPVEVVPAPKETRDSCGLAIRTFATHAEALGKILAEEGIPFKRYD